MKAQSKEDVLSQIIYTTLEMQISSRRICSTSSSIFKIVGQGTARKRALVWVTYVIGVATDVGLVVLFLLFV